MNARLLDPPETLSYWSPVAADACRSPHRTHVVQALATNQAEVQATAPSAVIRLLSRSSSPIPDGSEAEPDDVEIINEELEKSFGLLSNMDLLVE